MKIDLVSTANFELDHPWDQYAWLRANAPVYWHPEADGPGFWAITKYDDIRTVSRQPFGGTSPRGTSPRGSLPRVSPRAPRSSSSSRLRTSRWAF